MAILAYFDAAGDAKQPILGVAGFLARPEQWQAFSTEWRDVLLGEQVTELHMKHFAHSRGEFSRWKGDEQRRAAFLGRLADTVRRHTLKSVTVSLFMDHYNDFNKAYYLREALGGPYALASLFAINLANVWRDEQHSGEPISYVFESGDTEQTDLLTTLRRLKLDGEFNVTFMPKRSRHAGVVEHHYPFQSCDFLAYEIGKAGRTILQQDESQGKLVSEIKARKSLLQLMPIGRDRSHRFLDTGLLTEFCRRFRVRRRSPRRLALRFRRGGENL